MNSYEKRMSTRRSRSEGRVAVDVTGELPHRSKRARRDITPSWILAACEAIDGGADLRCHPSGEHLFKDGERLAIPIKNIFTLLHGGWLRQDDPQRWHYGDFDKPFYLTDQARAALAKLG